MVAASSRAADGSRVERARRGLSGATSSRCERLTRLTDRREDNVVMTTMSSIGFPSKIRPFRA
jgi:hypothetical protein